MSDTNKTRWNICSSCVCGVRPGNFTDAVPPHIHIYALDTGHYFSALCRYVQTVSSRSSAWGGGLNGYSGGITNRQRRNNPFHAPTPAPVVLCDIGWYRACARYSAGRVFFFVFLFFLGTESDMLLLCESIDLHNCMRLSSISFPGDLRN